jgi:phosphate transport system substrate-binding protein
MIRKSLIALGLGAMLASAAGVASYAAVELKVHGSATVAKSILLPNQGAIETETGLALTVVANGSGNGLKDLVAGKADVAIISAPIKVEEELTNRKSPGSLDVSGLQEHPIGAKSINFILNPKNPVKTLSEDQLKAIFTGKITSWKDVGGPDKPILLVIETAGNGTRANVTAVFLAGAEFAKGAREMQALAQVAKVVAQAPHAIGYGNSSSISDAVLVIQGTAVKQPLAIVTKGAPTAEVQKLIAASSRLGGS